MSEYLSCSYEQIHNTLRTERNPGLSAAPPQPLYSREIMDKMEPPSPNNAKHMEISRMMIGIYGIDSTANLYIGDLVEESNPLDRPLATSTGAPKSRAPQNQAPPRAPEASIKAQPKIYQVGEDVEAVKKDLQAAREKAEANAQMEKADKEHLMEEDIEDAMRSKALKDAQDKVLANLATRGFVRREIRKGEKGRQKEKIKEFKKGAVSLLRGAQKVWIRCLELAQLGDDYWEAKRVEEGRAEEKKRNARLKVTAQKANENQRKGRKLVKRNIKRP